MLHRRAAELMPKIHWNQVEKIKRKPKGHQVETEEESHWIQFKRNDESWLEK